MVAVSSSQISGKAAIASKAEKMEDFEVGKVKRTLYCCSGGKRDLRISAWHWIDCTVFFSCVVLCSPAMLSFALFTSYVVFALLICCGVFVLFTSCVVFVLFTSCVVFALFTSCVLFCSLHHLCCLLLSSPSVLSFESIHHVFCLLLYSPSILSFALFSIWWWGGSIGRVLNSRSKNPGFKPCPRQEHKKNLWELFWVKNVVLARCRCAKPLCVYARMRMITYAH